MNIYSAVCFDFDYTLGDSTDAIVAGFEHAFQKLGQPKPEREAVRGTIGYLLEDAYSNLTGDYDAGHRALFRKYFVEMARPRMLEETVLLPGAVELLKGLKGKGVRLGIVSTKAKNTIEQIMERHGLLEDLDFIIGTFDVTHHKPDPEGLLMALEKMGTTKSKFLYCGDTVLDAEAAQRAGVDFAPVLNGTTPAEDFVDWPNVHIAKDLNDLAEYLQV